VPGNKNYISAFDYAPPRTHNTQAGSNVRDMIKAYACEHKTLAALPKAKVKRQKAKVRTKNSGLLINNR